MAWSVYHLIRWSVAPSHATAWTAAAFLAAGVYAYLTWRLLRTEQTPIVVLDGQVARNLGRGAALNTMLFYPVPEQVWGIGHLGAGRETPFDAGMIGQVESRIHRLYYQASSGTWYVTRISRGPTAIKCAFGGTRVYWRVPQLVRKRATPSAIMSYYVALFPLKTFPRRFALAARWEWNRMFGDKED